MEPSPSRSNSEILMLALSLHSIAFMLALTNIRTQMMKENQSAFEINGNGVSMVVAIVALTVVEVTSGILLCTNIRGNILKFIGIFSACLATFSLLKVILPEHNLVWYLFSYVIFGSIFASSTCILIMCYPDDDDDKNLNKSSCVSIFTCLGLVLVPLALVFVLFVPKNLDWIVYSVIYPSIGMEVICFLILVLKDSIYITITYDDNRNLEAHQGIQHT
ncbi:hypothetical protein HanPI659440_Chr05g0217311 [Helianthus annuus]|nr:hypothetical protein HanPI659440_Chr05g0217311 [Helianthus annuus]